MEITIGITKALHPFGSPARRAIQEFLVRHDMTPYLPQCAILRSGDLAEAYRPGEGLAWPEAAWAEVKRFRRPPVVHLGDYWLEYSSESAATLWRWRTAEGREVTWDTATDEELHAFWAEVLASFRRRGVERPWVFIDEPPASARHGLTPAVQARVTRLVRALVEAGWEVGVATPGPSQLAFWRKHIAPTLWILGAKHEREDYKSLPAAEIWLYNRTSKRGGKLMAGLCEQMIAFGATGYLHWSFDSTVGTRPLGRCGRSGPEWFEDGLALLDERRRYEVWRAKREVARGMLESVRASLATLQAQLGSLEAELEEMERRWR